MNESKLQKPELMSPAGHWPQLKAAIEAGADAVYFGLDHFSARAKVGFQVEELSDVMRTLHERGVKGFVTFNTLVFDDELQKAEDAIIAISNAGCDAIIVQDTGIAQMARLIAPQLDIHGSTQMSITSAQGAELAKSFGCNRVVLGRELSLKDIEKIREATNVELEVFVHGALCVSYSGQCFSSEAWGGRSANRGKCAQACRLSYELIVDGQLRETGSDRYLLSPGDLYAIEQIPELVRIGVSCLKIEGRYKDENYVALTTAAYRKAIDAAFNSTSESKQEIAEQKLRLEQIYSRGLDAHFMQGINHQTVVQGRAPRHRGLRVGKVVFCSPWGIEVETEHAIRPGDGLVFDAANWRSPDEPEEGGNVYEVVEKKEGVVQLRFGEGEVDSKQIKVGDLVWRTSDPKLLVQLKPLAKAKKISFTRAIDFQVSGSVSEKLTVVGTCDDELTFTTQSESDLQPAENRGLGKEKLHEQLGRLGKTPFHIGELTLQLPEDPPLFLPVSQLNEVRRAIVDGLLEQRRNIGTSRPTNAGVIKSWFERGQQFKKLANSGDSRKSVAIHLLVRNAEQLDAAIECRPASITLDYLELYGLRPAVQKIKDANLVARVASPRILKPSEQNVVRFLLGLECPIVVRSGGLLHDLFSLSGEIEGPVPSLIGDFSLNAANVVSANAWLDENLDFLTPAYDLNAKQIRELCNWVAPEFLEVIAYSHLPVFHTEHCVFCRFMSDGTDSTNCGHPCEKHRVALRDQSGRLHPVMADVGCRNTVFGAEAQVAPEALASWQEAGIANYRLEFVHEDAEQVRSVTTAFMVFFAGEVDATQLANSLTKSSPAGITEGSFYVPLTT